MQPFQSRLIPVSTYYIGHYHRPAIRFVESKKSNFAYLFFRCDSEANLTPEERKELLAIQAIGDAQRYSGKYLRGTDIKKPRKGYHVF